MYLLELQKVNFHLRLMPEVTNDIGQFSDIDFSKFVSYENKSNIIRILTIGDSQEALQVDNSNSFHGLFNNYEKTISIDDNQNKFQFVSTSIGSAGMAFPNYIQYLKYASKYTDLESDFILVSVQSNDYDESEEYAILGRRAGRGQFF